MPFDSWDDVLFWHGSLIGYAAGVKAACEDKKKSDLLLEMAEVQSKLEIEELKNSKLLELVRRYGEYTSQDRCEGCVCKSRCNDGEVDECWQRTEIRELARELGIEVDG